MRYLIVTEAEPTSAIAYRLWGVLEGLGILKEECALLPLLGSEKPKGANQRIVATQFDAALPAFRETLASSEAEAVITCGGAAFRAVTGLKWDHTKVAAYILFPEDCLPIQVKQRVQIGLYITNNKARGIKAGDPKYGMRLMGMPAVLPKGCRIIVPSITIENVIKSRWKNVTQFRAAFTNAKAILDGASLHDADFTFRDTVPSPDDIGGGTIAYDLEVPINSTAIERASIASEEGAWSFPWSVEAVDAFNTILPKAAVRVAHNQQFDIPILRHHGIEVNDPTFDTMLAAGLLEPDLPKGLQPVAPIYLRLRPWKHLSETRGFADPYYNAKDAFVERLLAVHLQLELEDAGMADLFNTRIMPSVAVLTDMTQRGIRLHPERATAWCRTLEDELLKAETEWTHLYPDVNPRSPRQLSKLFYKTWGIQAIRKKGDGICTDESAVRTLAARYPQHRTALAILTRIRQHAKDLSTYGRVALGVDFIHPSYLPVGKDGTDRGADKRKGMAATGRLAASNPNIQNQTPEARLMYIPDHPDWCFMEFDWSQAELRIAATLAGDTAMLEALSTDIHSHTMAQMGCDRTRAKNVLYGSAYGAGAKKIKETLWAKSGIDISIKECEALQRGLAETYPTWWAWRWSVAERGAEQQYLVNPFGRVRRFPMGGADTPAMLDFLPQATVGDMAWTCYLPVWKAARARGGRLTTVVHDSFLLQVPAEEVDATRKSVLGILEQPFNEIAPGFYLPATVKVGAPGASWGELESV